MAFIDTKSSNLAGVEYFPEVKKLFVVFNGASTKLFLYHDVEKSEVDALLTAKSIGSHFARAIRPKKFAVIDSEILKDMRVEALDHKPYAPPSTPLTTDN